MVMMGLSIFLMGAIGLAIDGSHLYAQRQLAQAAADAAAQAGIMSIFDGTNTSGTHQFAAVAGTTYTCSSTNPTPCYYAQTLNGFGGAGDTVTYTPNPTGVTFSNLSALDPINLLQVTITRNVPATVMTLLGWNTIPVSATGTAAILQVMSPVPIIVTHPSMAGALSSNGNPTVTICGGPSLSIQVNSNDTSSGALGMNSNTTIDLSHAGPLDPGDCSTGTGADFGVFGLPASSPFTFLKGAKPGAFRQPNSPIDDPLAGVSAPSTPSAAPAPTALANGVSGCPASPAKPCFLYAPGLYSSGINVANQTAVFEPGIYYVTSNGFQGGANSDMEMATGFTDGSANRTGATSATCCGTSTGWTGNILVYNTGNGSGDVFKVGSNGVANLVGSPSTCPSSPCPTPYDVSYKGILFFEDRNSAAHVGPPSNKAHTLGGGGSMTLKGTIYITNTKAVMTTTPSQYQELDLQGTPGSTTTIQGEIITSNLNLGGNAGITMNLSSLPSYRVRQIALVQ